MRRQRSSAPSAPLLKKHNHQTLFMGYHRFVTNSTRSVRHSEGKIGWGGKKGCFSTFTRTNLPFHIPFLLLKFSNYVFEISHSASVCCTCASSSLFPRLSEILLSFSFYKCSSSFLTLSLEHNECYQQSVSVLIPSDVGENFVEGRTNLKLVRRPCESDKILN